MKVGTISAKVICDSIHNDSKVRLTTFELHYPRFILAELNTHRMFSRSTASSRAIPVKKVLSNMRNDLAMPLKWGINQAGMQAEKSATGKRKKLCVFFWKMSAIVAMTVAKLFMYVGIHKQVVNRIIEPFVMIKTVLTATEYENFFNLRDHEAAQPEIRELARCMKTALANSSPIHKSTHVPYIIPEEKIFYKRSELAQISAARCARVSYLNHDGKKTPEKDLMLFKKLDKMGHFSPTEHQAISQTKKGFANYGITHKTKDGKFYSGNFQWWIQYRHANIKGEIKE